MNKKIIILLFLLLLTGCKARYNLQINFGGNYVETGTVSFNSSLLGKGGYSSKDSEFLNQLGKKYNFNWITKKLRFNNGNYFGYDFYQRYRNVSSYSNQSPALKSIFNSVSIDDNNHYVKLNTRGFNNTSKYHNPTSDFPTIVEGIEVNITLPYKVVRNNANSVNTETNTYTWIFNSSTPDTKGINLEYQDNVLYTYNPVYLFKFVSPYVYISILLILIALIVISSVRTKARFRNRI